LYQLQILPEKFTFYGMVLKSITYLTLAGEAADEIRITIFLKLRRKEKLDLSNWKQKIIP
jgi:hypothetical protein